MIFFFLIFEPWPLCFYFVLGPANYVALLILSTKCPFNKSLKSLLGKKKAKSYFSLIVLNVTESVRVSL